MSGFIPYEGSNPGSCSRWASLWLPSHLFSSFSPVYTTVLRCFPDLNQLSGYDDKILNSNWRGGEVCFSLSFKDFCPVVWPCCFEPVTSNASRQGGRGLLTYDNHEAKGKEEVRVSVLPPTVSLVALLSPVSQVPHLPGCSSLTFHTGRWEHVSSHIQQFIMIWLKKFSVFLFVLKQDHAI